MREIKKLPDTDLERFVDIQFDAYPTYGNGTKEEKEKVKERLQKKLTDPRVALYGVYDDDTLLADAIFYDYNMNSHGQKVLAGGIGSIAVSLTHKKQHLAYDLMQFYLEHYRDRGAPFAVLWPFRHDFYHQMGCGLGTKVHIYKTSPDNLPKGSAEHIRFLIKEDIPLITACYNRYADRVTGMIEESESFFERTWTDSKASKFVGCVRDGQLTGYIVFGMEKVEGGTWLDNDIRVRVLIYEDRETLAELLAFLQNQFDQISHIIIQTTDENFHHLFHNPTAEPLVLHPSVNHEANATALGIMYRVLNTRLVFETLSEHDFGGQSCRLKLTVNDSFFEANNGSLVIHFDSGRVAIMPDDAGYDVELTLDVAEFSSLVMGVVDFKSLYDYKLADVSDTKHLDTLHRLFATDHKPVCLTDF